MHSYFVVHKLQQNEIIMIAFYHYYSFYYTSKWRTYATHSSAAKSSINEVEWAGQTTLWA